MSTHLPPQPFASSYSPAHYPVDVTVQPKLIDRNRLTTFFRPILGIPHVMLVGGPVAFAGAFFQVHDGRFDWSAGVGVLGAVASVAAVIGWFAIVFGARYPGGLYSLASLYLRWRVRAAAYLSLLTDDYPPFGDAPYPAQLQLVEPGARQRLTVAFRIVLAIPHLIAVACLGLVWCFTTFIAWLSILFTGQYPEPLYHFGVGMLRWTARVEAYVLLLVDDYPPFSFS